MPDLLDAQPAVSAPRDFSVALEQWNATLDRAGVRDTYFRLEYVQASCLLEPGEPVLFHVQDTGGHVVLACIRRPLDDGRCDLITPYGYGGPVATGERPPVDAFARALSEWAARESAVTSFTRFHPLCANHDYAGPAIDVDALAGTVAWRVEAARDLLAGMHTKQRYNTRRAQRAGITARVVQAPESLDSFRELYEQTMHRQHASEFYFFPAEYWQALERDLRDELVLVEAVRKDELLASILCFGRAPWLHYHLGASSDAAREVAANNVAFLGAAQWAQDNGFSHLHLGGGVSGRADSLFDYKQRFDPGGRIAAAIGRQVFDMDTYEKLSGTCETSGFFPRYRQPR